MPSLESALKAYLKSKTAITSLVGTGDSARIYLNVPKQGVVLPYIVFEVFEGSSAEHLTGVSGIAENRVQIDCYGGDEESAHNLAEAVRLAPLQMFRGELMSGVFANSVSSPIGYRLGFDPPTAGGNDIRFWASRDYLVTYSEPTGV